MTHELNAYQIYILRELYELPLMYLDIFMLKQVWLRNNAFERKENLASWEQGLINEGYVSKEMPIFFSMIPDTESLRIRIEQRGKDYLALLFLSEIGSVASEDNPMQESKKLTLIECAILHVYLGRSDSQQRISKTNSGKFALDECGLSKPSSRLHLYQEYGQYQEDSFRLTLHSANKTAAKVDLILLISLMIQK